MSTYQRAREALGLRLRELRRDARFTGRQLALSQGWDPSKVSKIEGGRQTPSEANVEAWTSACGRPELAGELIAALRTLETHYVQHRRLFRAGLPAQQVAFGDLEAGAEVIRNFENVFIPGLLQTPEYARHRLAEAVTFDGAPDNLDEAVAARMSRQQVLYRRGKRFHFVVTEAALRYRLCPVDVMTGQLDRLVTLSTMPGIRFGVIPFTVAYPVAPVHGFWIFDDRLVWVENLTASLNITQAGEVTAYLRAFGHLAEIARYGANARALMTHILEDLSGGMS
jgi:transcriptional regulator with XRE-family HTH domain